MYYKNEQLKNILASHNNCVFSLDKLCASALEYIQQIEAGVDRCYELAKVVEAIQPKWISAEERLPEGEVLAANFAPGTFGYKEYIIGYVSPPRATEPGGCFAENEHEILYNVTHWMPLPEPPKERKHE